MTKLNLEQLTNLNLLLSIDGIGPGKIRNLLSKFRTTEKILSADFQSLMEVGGISTHLAKRIHKAHTRRDEILADTEKELSKLEKIGGNIITVWDSEYPSLLKKIYDPPLLIYTLGEFKEEDKYSIAVVGTRIPTSYGKLQAERIVI